ncbi:MAG: hypothetical protein ABFR75_00565 [Acidobacteriota bacterium]
MVIVFSSITSCKDRIFNNPFDPDKDERGFEILSVINIENRYSPTDITFSGNSLWITPRYSGAISINYNSGAVIRRLEFNNRPVNGIGYDGSDLWLNLKDAAEVTNVNIVNGEIIKSLKLPEGNYIHLDFHSPNLYIADRQSNSILSIDPDSGTILDTIRGPSFTIDGICFDGTSFWILELSTLKIFKIDINGDIVNTYRSPTETPSGLCCSDGIIWLGDSTGKILKLRFQ